MATDGLKQSIETAKRQETTCPACSSKLTTARQALPGRDLVYIGLLARRLHRHVTRAHGEKAEKSGVFGEER